MKCVEVDFQKNDTIRNISKKHNIHHRFSPEGQHIQVLDLCAAPGSKAEKLGGWVPGGCFSYGFLQWIFFFNPIKKRVLFFRPIYPKPAGLFSLLN